MKTVWITVYDGAISKNILRTSVFAELQKQCRIVLFVPKAKQEFYRGFIPKTVRIEATPEADHPLFENRFHALALDSFPTHTVYLKIWHDYKKNRSVLKLLLKLFLWTLGKTTPFHRFMRQIYATVPDRSFDSFFAACPPDCVFLPNMMSNEDYRLIKAARKRRILSIGMPKSWDNFTSKTFFNIFPDRILVQNEIMKEEAVRLFSYPRKHITVVGFPQFDIYARQDEGYSRTEFLSSLGLDPEKRTILYAAAGHQLAPYDEEVLSGLIHQIQEDPECQKIQILVRPHPKYEFQEKAIPRFTHVVVDRPGSLITNKRSSWEFEDRDISHLMRSLRAMDVLISTVSTLNLEGAIFDKPLISIGFEGSRHVPFELSAARYYQYDHMRPIVQTGGMQVAYNRRELLDLVKRALREPGLHCKERKMIVERIVGGNDGNAGLRVANYIISAISHVKSN